MKPGLRTLLRGLIRHSSEEDTQTTTYYIPSQPSAEITSSPPKVQPRLPSSSFFHGRDHFTTDQLIRHRLDRSKRAILRKQIEQGPEYPDISRYAGYWGPSLTACNFDFPAAKLCDVWRHDGVALLKLEDLEDQARRDRMEKRVVKGLEPEFTRGLDKEEFKRKMEMQFGWIDGHAGMTGVVGDGRRIVNEDQDRSRAGNQVERSVTPWPSKESMFMAPEQGASTVSSVENYQPSCSYEQISAVPEPLRLSKLSRPKAGGMGSPQTQLERQQHANAQEDFFPRRLRPELDPFSDNAYPTLSYSSSSVSARFSSNRDATCQGRPPEEIRPSRELLISRKAEPPGPSLHSPFSWPEVLEGQSSCSSKKLLPPKLLSERSFQSMSNQVAHSTYPLCSSAARKDVPMPKRSREERNSGCFEIIERVPKAAVDARREPNLGNKSRASKARQHKARVAKEATMMNKNRGFARWLWKLW